MSIKVVEEMQKYFRRERDPFEASVKTLKQQCTLNKDQAAAFIEPNFKAMIGEGCHTNKELSF